MLILRDVLRWSAAEVAEALDTTTAAVNSALQRAHAVMADKQPEPGHRRATSLTPAQQVLLDQYVDAFWRKDIDAIVGPAQAEAVWEMPPFTGWYVGAENIGKLIATQCPGGVHDMVMLPTTRQRPAGVRALHARRRRTATSSPFHLQVLDLDGDRVRHVGGVLRARGCSRSSGCPPGSPPTRSRPAPGPARA